MTGEGSTADSAMAHLVEQQARNWELARAQYPAEKPPKEKDIFEFIAISHSEGLPTGEIASRLGEQLGWPVFNKQILHEMADNDAYRERIYQSMDERDMNWLEDILVSMTIDRFGRNDYFHKLVKTVLSIARRGHAIFVSHATDLILPQANGLRIRLVATREFCAQARQHGKAEQDVAKELEQAEREHAQFVRHHFQAEEAAETRHDLIINTERFSADETLAVILAALHARGVDT